MSRAPIAAALVALCLSACGDQTGILLEVDGPANQSTVTAGIVQLKLIASHGSYCGRWVRTASEASDFTVDVTNRDLTVDPISILISPDQNTDLMDAVRATVLGLDASGQLIGYASLSSQKFANGKVDKFAARMTILGPGKSSTGPKYLADDGCVCIPGQSHIGTSTGTGCDQLIPPTYKNLVGTAGCELPQGEALPIGVCDGQLYPGERPNRAVPCFAARASTCRVGQRVCNDQDGRGVDRECIPTDATLTLPSSALCDEFLRCERIACGDPTACLEAGALTHAKLHCVLPLSPTPMAGAAQMCDGGSWSFPIAAASAATGAQCVATMLDGPNVGAVTLGWNDAKAAPQIVSANCPPTLSVSGVAVSDPTAAEGTFTFGASIGDQLYDITLDVVVGCPSASGDPAGSLHCEAM